LVLSRFIMSTDWQDIPPSTEWLAEVFEAIEQADTFVFVISGISVESDICKLETAHASKNNKRIIPVVIDEVEPHRVTTELAALNWLFFREQDEFSRAFQDLLTAIQTDYAWVKEHTRLQVRALEWERKDRNSGYLLRGRDLVEAEGWLAQAEDKDPQPTDLHREYIADSRKAAKRRRLITVGATTISVAIIIAAAIIVTIVIRQKNETRISAVLMQAALSDDLDAAKTALKEGANVNARDMYGVSPLLYAVLGTDTAMPKLLIEAGAHVNARDSNGDTPLSVAESTGMQDFLKQHGGVK
jgi:TIR domain/Ankyrin repeats (3 copies)